MIIPTTTTITYPTAWGSGGCIVVAVASLLCSWSWDIATTENQDRFKKVDSSQLV